MIKLTALHSAKLHRRAPSPGGDPLGKLFLHCEHFAEGRLPSRPFNLLIIPEQFWVNLNLSSLYSGEPPNSPKKNTVSFWSTFGRAMNILRSQLPHFGAASGGCWIRNSSVMPEWKMLLKFHRLPFTVKVLT